MKKYTIVVILGLLAFHSASAQKIVIDGRLEGIEDSTHISLFKEEGNVGTRVAGDSVVNGHFHIEYTPQNDHTEKYSLMSSDKGFPSMSLPLWAKKGTEINIKGKDKLIYTWSVESNAPEQKEWSYFIQSNIDSLNAYQRLAVTRKALVDKIINGENVSKTERKQIKMRMDSLDKASKVVDRSVQEKNLALLQKGKMNPVRMEVLSRVASSIKWDSVEAFRAPVTKLYNKLTPEEKNSVHGQEIALILYPPHIVKAGEPMYDTLLTDLAGRTYHLADFKGRYILLDFWSYGCGPCHASVPEMKEIAEKLKDSLTVVSLSSDNRKMWKEASDYFKMTWNNLSDGQENRGIYAKYGVTVIPNYVLIAPDGTIKDIWTGYYGEGSLKSKIKELTGFVVAADMKKE
ncbi:MAG: TlpA disulfide reductase family protein [Chitinophagaceae bacterium]